MQHIRYNPANDPQAYLAQALQQFSQASLARRQRRQFQKGLSPTMTPMQIMQKALQSGYDPKTAIGFARLAPTQQQGFTLGPGQTRFTGAGERVAGVPKAESKATKDEVRYWIDKGYSSKDAQKNARLAAEIAAGLKPRSSSAKHYDNMSDVEKMKFLQTLKRSAEGPYYRTISGTEEPLNPKVAEWAEKELEKLPMFQGKATNLIMEVPPGTTFEEAGHIGRKGIRPLPPTQKFKPEELVPLTAPQSYEEFIQKVKSIKDDAEAKAYYDKWISKWQ